MLDVSDACTACVIKQGFVGIICEIETHVVMLVAEELGVHVMEGF